MAKTKIQEVIDTRQISATDLDLYVNEGWKKSHSVGQSSVIITRTRKVEVEVPEMELEAIDRQIKALQEKRKTLTKEEKPNEAKK